MAIPRTFNKAQLCFFLGLTRRKKGKDGKEIIVVLYRELRRDFMTPDILDKLKMTKEEYKKTRIFRASIARILIEEFDLKDE